MAKSQSFFLVTRALPQAKETAEKLEKMGIKTLVEPCIRIQFNYQQESISFKKNTIIIVTSKNGAEAFAMACSNHNFRIITVGRKAQDFLCSKGFSQVIHSAKHMNDLLKYIKLNFVPREDEFIYFRARHVAKNLKSALPDHHFREVISYEAVAKTNFSKVLIELIKEGKINGLLLYSARTAKIFAELAEKAGISKFLDKMIIFCLSPSLVEVCRAIPHREIFTAATPTENSLLKLVKKYVDNSR